MWNTGGGTATENTSPAREVERLIEGQQERGARPLLVAPDVPAWLARVGGLPDVARLKGGLSTTLPLRGDEREIVQALSESEPLAFREIRGPIQRPTHQLTDDRVKGRRITHK